MNLAVQAPRAFATPAFLQLLSAGGADLLARWPARSRRANEPTAAGRATASQAAALPNGIRRLALLGNAMLHKCRNASQPLSLLVFDFSELPELQALFGRRVMPGLGVAIANKLQGIATRAVVVRASTTRFAVLLPGFDAASARRAVTSALGKAGCLDFDVRDSEMLLVPEFAVRAVHRDEEFVEAVYQNICLELLSARQHQQRRHDYLTRERESHTRPPKGAPRNVAAAAS